MAPVAMGFITPGGPLWGSVQQWALISSWTPCADGPLKNLPSMDRFCRQNGGAITEDGRSYGYLAEMGSYRFCLRCTPSPGEYQCYLYCYDLRQQTLNRPVGRVTFANGEPMEFTAPQNYLRTIREELPTKDLTGFRFETLTDDPAVRKAVDDMVYDLYGEENPRPLEDYTSRQGHPERAIHMNREKHAEKRVYPAAQ